MTNNYDPKAQAYLEAAFVFNELYQLYCKNVARLTGLNQNKQTIS